MKSISRNEHGYLLLLKMLLIISLVISSNGYLRNSYQGSAAAQTEQNEVHVAVNGSDSYGKGTMDAILWDGLPRS